MSASGPTRSTSTRSSDGKWTGAIGYSHPITYYGGVNEGIVMLTDDRYAGVAPPPTASARAPRASRTAGRRHAAVQLGLARRTSGSSTSSTATTCAEDWIAEADAPWLTLSASARAATATEQRVTVKVDWSRLDAGATGTIRVYNAVDGVKSGDPVATFTVEADKAAVDLAGHPRAR